MDFQEALPVKRDKSGGRVAADNPFTDVISKIALQVYPEGHAYAGKPVARSYRLVHENTDAVKKDRSRVNRQTADAGKKNTPPVTVRVDFQDDNKDVGVGKNRKTEYATIVTFWTTPPQKRPRKKKTDETSTPVTTEKTPTATAES